MHAVGSCDWVRRNDGTHKARLGAAVRVHVMSGVKTNLCLKTCLFCRYYMRSMRFLQHENQHSPTGSFSFHCNVICHIPNTSKKPFPCGINVVLENSWRNQTPALHACRHLHIYFRVAHFCDLFPFPELYQLICPISQKLLQINFTLIRPRVPWQQQIYLVRVLPRLPILLFRVVHWVAYRNTENPRAHNTDIFAGPSTMWAGVYDSQAHSNGLTVIVAYTLNIQDLEQLRQFTPCTYCLLCHSLPAGAINLHFLGSSIRIACDWLK